MATSLASLADNIMVGNDAGWQLAFFTEGPQGVLVPMAFEIGRDRYYADIQATLPSGLEGGVYNISVEGMTDDDYKRLEKATAAKLYLYWRDTDSSLAAYLTSVAGLGTGLLSAQLGDFLVAQLTIKSRERKLGKQRYEVEIVARERIYDRLDRRLTDAIADQVSAAAVNQLFTKLGIGPESFKSHALGPASAKPPFRKGDTAVALLRRFAERIEQGLGKYGRGMLLIRDGVLNIGERPIPLDRGKETNLTLAGGLIECPVIGKEVKDPNADPTKEPPTRTRYRVVLKGRPDIKPGDVVSFECPSAGKASIYVDSVDHRLGRTTGFVTTISGVTVDGNAWDTHTPLDGSDAETAPSPTSASPAVDAARAVHAAVKRVMRTHLATDVGEVRAATTCGTADLPAQTQRVWEGLVPSDGAPFGARRLAVARPGAHIATAMPYASPFAWGKCGLVLPRYPGTRVVVTHRDGRDDDPIEIGALWESAYGPDSSAGDWWLILPVGVAQSARASIPDTDAPQDHTGNATNDLIDADGNRIIEVGELTLRVGTGGLQPAGTRPARPSETGGVLIEHKDGLSSIQMTSEGEIIIKTGKNGNLTLQADGGTIKLKAQNVDVEVGGQMNVH